MLRPVVLVLALLTIAGPGIDADQGRGQGRGRGNADPTNPTTVTAVFAFNNSDRETFRTYFTTHKITATALPPGIAKNLERGKPLPPGIAKKALPNDLVVTLGRRVQPGVTFAIYGDRVVALRSGVVIDVMVNVFR